MANEETPYEQGLHYGYGIARFESHLYENLKNFVEPTSEFAKGTFAGGKEYDQESESLRLQQLDCIIDTHETTKEEKWEQ